MFNIEEASVRSMQEAMDSGEVTSSELVCMYFERIALYDKDGPKLNAVLEVNPDALYIAEAMDHERRTKGVRGPLHGIPVLIKDNINTRDKMHTSAGSLALADSYAPYDAFLVEKLREAGAVIMGKANMTEFANFMTDRMPSGYSSRGGQVLNPYDVTQTPSGSSSGSAVAVAANLCAVSVGTETCGSIISPAYANGIVGIKPTVGLVSRSGIIPISSSQDTAGPMARTVEDAALLLGAMTGVDQTDPATWASEGRRCSDYTQFLDAEGLKGMRMGVNRGYYEDFNQSEIRVIEEAVTTLEDCGAILIQDMDMPHLGEDSSVLLQEFKPCMNAYLASLGPAAPVRTLREIIDFNNAHPVETLKYGQTLLLGAEFETSGTLTEAVYLQDRLKDISRSRKEGLDKILDENNLEVLLCPGVTDIAAVAGYPSIIVPAGFTENGMPFGVTFIGRAYSEPVLLKAAYAFEQAAKARKAPVLNS